MGPFGESVAAWVLAPLVLLILTVGLGLLVERVARIRMATALLAPVGLCTLIVLVMPGYRLGVGSWLAVAITLACALAGLWFARRDLRTRLRPGWLLGAGVATYGLYIAAVVLAGGWTWTGYNFVNDTAVQMVLADWLGGHGTSMPPGPPELAAQSTTGESLRIYLLTAYPVGAHSALATVAALVPAPLAAVYQPFIALCAALTAVSLGALARSSGVAPLAAALAGCAALAANLPFVYALQGNLKEVAMVSCLAAAAAVGREAIGSPRPAAHVGVVAVCLAAGISSFSAAAVPYVGAFAAVLLAAALLARDSTLRRRLLPAAAVGAVVLVAASVATLVKIVTFGEVAEGTFAVEAVAEDLGHLLRPLELVQTAGIWMVSDYRVAVPPGREWINQVLIGAVAIALVAGVAVAVRRREPGPLLMLVPAVIALVVLEPRTSPYATGKMLMLASPGIVLTAAVALGWLAERRRVLALAVALPLAAGMLVSDALAFHHVRLAPIDRMLALQQIGDRFAGEPRGENRWLLVDEREEFAKYFMRRARTNVALELVTPIQVRNQLRASFIPLHADLDQMTLEFLVNHPLIAQRRGADSSRPPASYRPDGGNRYYAVWRRDPAVEVRVHVPIQSLYEGFGVPDCGAVRELAAGARPGERLFAATAPAQVRFDTAHVGPVRGWPPHPSLPDTLIPGGPGTASATLEFEPGRYRVWLIGSTGRAFEVRIDGRKVASPDGVNTPGEWLDGGTVTITGGRHLVELVRPSGSPAPGDGFLGGVGPLVFERSGGRQVLDVAPDDAGQLCGRRLDWIELGTRR